jgi:HAD superfamily hydrolase (TIGR01509 family)
MRVAAVLFDMDGVVADNTHFHDAAWLHYAKEVLGIELPEDAPKHFFGRTHEVVERLLGRALTPAQARYHHEGKEALYRNLARGRMHAVPGVADYLSWLDEHGIPTALVTNSDPVCVEFVLNELDLVGRFAAQVNANDVRHAKPDPEPYLLAAARLGVPATECLIHEDTLGGVRAGLAAGAAIATVTTTLPATVLLEAGAHWATADFNAWRTMLAQSKTAP